MTIKEAVGEAKALYNWSIVPHEPTSVCVQYKTKDGALSETEFDLYLDDPETELVDLWERLCEELGTGRDAVESVAAYGYVLE